MRPIMERRLINGRMASTKERIEAELSRVFLEKKYFSARKFLWMLWDLKLFDVYRKLHVPFGPSYLADKLTQHHTFGEYDAERPERGSWDFDPNSVCACPTWFSKSQQVDEY